MDASRKSFEMQAQVRQNAEDFKNVINDIYNWEKDIKEKEKQMQARAENKFLPNLPIRSHTASNQNNMDSVNQNVAESKPPNNTKSTSESNLNLLSPSEKCNTPLGAMDVKRKEANAIKEMGNKYVKLTEYSNAIDAYSQAISMFSEDPVYYSNRALCYLKLERYDECIEDCDRAIAIDSLSVKAYYRRMMANESLANNMDALKDCTTVLMIEPKNIEAKRSLERINERLRKHVKTTNSPNFSSLRSNLVDILPIEKPAYKRSSKPLKRVAIADVVGPKESKNYENLKISDEDIDKLFNSNCGYFEEIKKPIPSQQPALELLQQQSIKPVSNIVQKEALDNTSEENKKKLESIQDSNNNNNNSNKLQNSQIVLKDETIGDCNQLKPSEIAAKNNANKQRTLPPAPISTVQFYSNWKELSGQEKYQYLKSIPIANLCKILGASFDSDTFSDIIRTLHEHYLPQNDAAAAATLFEISKIKQVSILSLLMSSEERKALSEIVNSLKENQSLISSAAEQIMKKLNIN